MTVTLFRRNWVVSLLLIPALPLTAPAQAATMPEVLQIGTDRIGQPCTATRDWTRSPGAIKRAEEQPFVVICRGASAAKIVAVVTPAKTPIGGRECGAASTLSIAELGTVTARLCQDANLGLQMVEIQSGGFVGASSAQALTPMLRLLRAVSADDPRAGSLQWAPAVNLAGLAPAPPQVSGTNRLADFNLDGALQQGILAIRGGELVTASRILNDALSRVGADTPSGILAELQLAAALADSGLGQFGPARQGLTAAEATLRNGRDADRNAYLERALRIYRSFDAINQREWQRALQALDTIQASANPLNDLVSLSSLNRDSENTRATGVSLKDKNL